MQAELNTPSGHMPMEDPPVYAPWHDGTGRRGFNFKTDSPISPAFYLLAIPDASSISYGDRDSVDPVNITHIELMAPQEERSKHKRYWAGTKGGLMDNGWSISYTDCTGSR